MPRTTRATQPVCSISVLSWPANSRIAGNGMVSPSESQSMAPTGNLAQGQNAVKQIRARKCLIVPVSITHRVTMYYGSHVSYEGRKNLNTENTEKGGDCGPIRGLGCARGSGTARRPSDFLVFSLCSRSESS